MNQVQTKLGSLVEAIVNTAASMGIFLSFGLPWYLVASLTLGMLCKNLLIRLIFAAITRRIGL